jgi:hypothetical protein
MRACLACGGSDDEGLVLVCDLCESPFHNNLHCAGFVTAAGYGDWFCLDCRAVVHEKKIYD